MTRTSLLTSPGLIQTATVIQGHSTVVDPQKIPVNHYYHIILFTVYSEVSLVVMAVLSVYKDVKSLRRFFWSQLVEVQ